jgi:hypothetical protein
VNGSGWGDMLVHRRLLHLASGVWQAVRSHRARSGTCAGAEQAGDAFWGARVGDAQTEAYMCELQHITAAGTEMVKGTPWKVSYLPTSL